MIKFLKLANEQWINVDHIVSVQELNPKDDQYDKFYKIETNQGGRLVGVITKENWHNYLKASGMTSVTVTEEFEVKLESNTIDKAKSRLVWEGKVCEKCGSTHMDDISLLYRAEKLFRCRNCGHEKVIYDN